MDVTTFYTKIPQEEGIETLCRAFDYFYKTEILISTPPLEGALVLQENSFQFKGKKLFRDETGLPWEPK